MPRIGFADHLFLRMHHGIGNPVFNQFLWMFDTPVSEEQLESLHSSLALGLLARRVDAPALPAARHRWVTSDVSLPFDLTAGAIEPDSVLHWADGRIVDEINPELGLGWQLSATKVVGGGMVVSLVCSHMVADGAAMVAAIRRANSERATVDATVLGRRPSSLRGIVDDMSDVIGQLKPVLSWGASKVALAVRRSSEPVPVTPVRSEPALSDSVDKNSGPWSPPYVVAECPAIEWHAAAAEWGGTSNSLFIGVLTAMSEGVGRTRPGDELRWSLPISDRKIDDIDSNSTKIVPVSVRVSERGDRDLTGIRKASKTAFIEFEARQTAGAAGGPIPLQLIQMLPDALVARLPMPKGGAEGLCSNLGRLPDDFTEIGGVRARSVAARATFSDIDADAARSLGGGSTAWMAEADDIVTITVHGMDPDRMASDERLRELLASALDRWNITHRFW